MTALAVLLGAVGITLLVTGLPLGRRGRLPARVEPYLSGLHGRPSSLLLQRHGGAAWQQALYRRVRRFLPDTNDELTRRLAAAGDRGGVMGFRMEQMAWTALGASSFGVLALVRALAGGEVEVRAVPPLLALGAAGGFAARDWWLGRQADRRRVAIRDELPTAIDLIALSVIAGEAVPAALARANALLSGPLADELQIVLDDIRGGSTAIEALEELSRRVPEPGIARFVDATCTAIEKGAPLADVLRGQADDGREARRRYLLEVGGQREVLMLVPVVFLIMPVVVVFALYPGFVSLDLLVP